MLHCRKDLCSGYETQHLPVGFDSIVYVNADIISDVLLLLLSFITNFLCVKNKWTDHSKKKKIFWLPDFDIEQVFVKGSFQT